MCDTGILVFTAFNWFKPQVWQKQVFPEETQPCWLLSTTLCSKNIM